jgi:hypothetical protein
VPDPTRPGQDAKPATRCPSGHPDRPTRPRQAEPRPSDGTTSRTRLCCAAKTGPLSRGTKRVVPRPPGDVRCAEPSAVLAPVGVQHRAPRCPLSSLGVLLGRPRRLVPAPAGQPS